MGIGTHPQFNAMKKLKRKWLGCLRYKWLSHGWNAGLFKAKATLLVARVPSLILFTHQSVALLLSAQKKGAISPEGSECAMAKRSRPWKTGDSGCPLGRVGRLLYQRREALMQTGVASFTLSFSCGCSPVPCSLCFLLKVLLSFSGSPPYPGCADGWS